MIEVIVAIIGLAALLFVPYRDMLWLRLAWFGLATCVGLVWLIHGNASKAGRGPISVCMLMLALFSIAMFLSIVFNGRGHVYQDYFEIVTVVCAGGAMILGYEIGRRSFCFAVYSRLFVSVSAIYVMANGAMAVDRAFGDQFGWIRSAYSPSHTEDASAILAIRGEADRFAGLSPNPNAHGALLILLLLNLRRVSVRCLWDRLVIAAVGVLIVLTQSRTGIAALIAVTSIHLIGSADRGRKVFLAFANLAAGIFLIVLGARMFNLTFVESLWSRNLLEQETISVRVDRWSLLFDDVMSSPVLGHAPQADYAERTGVHFDSEYVLVAWRYGCLGVVSYLLALLLPVWVALAAAPQFRPIKVCVFALFVATSIIGVTNVTLSDFRYAVIYSLLTGLCLGGLSTHRHPLESSPRW